MDISVVIACLNAENTLAMQLEALCNQDYSQPWELIIADNGSTDNSISIAEKYKNKFHEVKIIDASKKKGAAFATNIAILEASSDNIAICDADDEVTAGWLSAISKALINHDVVCGKMHFDKFNEPVKAKNATEIWKNGLYYGNFLPGGGRGNCGIKKTIHQKIGGFDECMLHAEDADYFWRLQLMGYKLYFEKDAIINIRIGRVNPSFPYMFRRGKNRAASNYWCYKRYRQYGMKIQSSIFKEFSTWLKVLKRGLAIYIKQEEKKSEWLPTFAQSTGRLVGQIQGKLTNPCKPLVLNAEN